MNQECLVQQRIVHYSFTEIFYQAAPFLTIMAIWRQVLAFIVVKWSKDRFAIRPKDIPKIVSDDKYHANIPILRQTYEKQLRKFETNKHQKAKINDNNHNTYDNNYSKFDFENNINADTTINSKHKLGFISQVQNDKELLPTLSRDLNLSSNDIVEYWKYLRKLDKIEKYLLKYNEEIWKCLTMTCITIYGIYVMCHEPFFNNPRLLFQQYPQRESSLIQRYYRISLGYHGFRAIYQFFEHKRKDFWAMTIHHWVTVILIVGSWWTGTMQIGALVMVCHDNADVFLPAAKIARYEKNALLTNITFALFLLSWVLSRIGLFSWKVVYPLLFQAYPTFTCSPYYTFFSVLLCVLLMLHFYWLRMIFNIAYTALFVSKVIDDNRSDDSDNDT